MKPPICEVCDGRFEPAEGALLRFVGNERSIAWREAAEADGRVGHPPDTAWFCGDHSAAAAALAETSTLGQALAALRPRTTAEPEPPVAAPTPSGEDRAGGALDSDGSPKPAMHAAADRSWLPDDYRRVEISPLTVDALSTRFKRFFDDLIDAFSTATGITPNRDDDETRRVVEQVASPEWREKGPASEEVDTTLAVRIGVWECRFIRSSHDWIHGGLIQSSAAVAVVKTDESETTSAIRVAGGVHAGSPVTVVSAFGQYPEFAAQLLDALLDELAL